ncbi:hypothetical protein [Falsihalocynthiibacter arcticus]|uniref:hypothetical protein n=1 Tax=Falsihalocynthiibacter arcticus TaxID=1579316 RepID=UPI003001FD5B
MAANRFRGELAVTCDGVDFTLAMDMNTMAAFETETGQSALSWAEAAETGGASIPELIAMVYCALQRHHPDAERMVAGDILGDNPEVLTLLFDAASPKVVKKPAGKPRAGRR